MKERINWIDVSRGLAFLMVIYSHLPLCNDRLMKFFSPVFLTTFFFVSGYLFKSGESFSKVLEQRVRTLLIPFVLLGLIMIAMSQVLSFNESHGLAESLKGLFFQNGENQILWFIAALFVYSLVFYWLDRWCASPRRLLVVSVVLFVANSILYHWLHVPHIAWHVECAGCACFYMAAGKLFRLYEARIDAFVKGWMLLAGLAVYIAYIYVSDLYIGHYGSYAVVDSMVVTLIGLALVVTVSKKYLNNSRFLLFVGANTLLYFAFHGKVYSLILSIMGKTAPGMLQPGNVVTELIVAAAVVLLDALILIYPSKAINRFCPQILGRNFKLWGTSPKKYAEK